MVVAFGTTESLVREKKRIKLLNCRQKPLFIFHYYRVTFRAIHVHSLHDSYLVEVYSLLNLRDLNKRLIQKYRI